MFFAGEKKGGFNRTTLPPILDFFSCSNSHCWWCYSYNSPLFLVKLPIFHGHSHISPGHISHIHDSSWFFIDKSWYLGIFIVFHGTKNPWIFPWCRSGAASGCRFRNCTVPFPFALPGIRAEWTRRDGQRWSRKEYGGLSSNNWVFICSWVIIWVIIIQ